jgi:hypothetical protein
MTFIVDHDGIVHQRPRDETAALAGALRAAIRIPAGKRLSLNGR